jgi:serine/threonine protein kinase
MSDSNSNTLQDRPPTSPTPSTSFGRLDIGRQQGRFRLDALIGEGGMGKVYEAWDPRLERRVAVKVLHAPDPLSRQRFMREARLQGAISHPGVCPVFEVGQTVRSRAGVWHLKW